MLGTWGGSGQRVMNTYVGWGQKQKRLLARREVGIENEAEEKACVHIPGEVQKSLAE